MTLEELILPHISKIKKIMDLMYRYGVTGEQQPMLLEMLLEKEGLSHIWNYMQDQKKIEDAEFKKFEEKIDQAMKNKGIDI